MRQLLYFPKWLDVLIKIKMAPENRRYCQKLHREVKTSINHFRAILKRLESKDFIEIYPSKKIKWIILTEKGKEASQAVMNIKSTLK